MTEITEINKIPNPPLMRKKFRSDEIHQMVKIGILPEESGWELIHGEIIHRMMIGSRHASVVKRINRILIMLFGERFIIGVQDPIHIDEYNDPEPDISLLKSRDDFYEAGHPNPSDVLLVLEVSDSTLEYDRDVKKGLYAKAGISEFWLVNLIDNTIERYSEPADGRYFQMKIFKQSEMIQAASIDNLQIQVSDLIRENLEAS